MSRRFSSTQSRPSRYGKASPPLCVGDIDINVLLDPAEREQQQRILTALRRDRTAIVESSYLTVPLDSKNRPTRRAPRLKPISLDDICLEVKLSNAEHHFYSDRTLGEQEVNTVSSWFAEHYSLRALQSTSIQILEQLQSAEKDGNSLVVTRLEQRALAIAEATAIRAAADAEHDVAQMLHEQISKNGIIFGRNQQNKRKGTISVVERRRIFRGKRCAELRVERQSLLDTLERFNAKHEAYREEDEAMADMLMPAKRDLEEKLGKIQAEIASYGGDKPFSVGNDTSCVARNGGEAESSDMYIPEPNSELFGVQSSDDEEDFEEAKTADAIELAAQFHVESSSREGYVSGYTDEGDDGNEYFGSAIGRQISDLFCKSTSTKYGVQYIIDLAKSRSSSLHEREASGDRCGRNTIGRKLGDDDRGLREKENGPGSVRLHDVEKARSKNRKEKATDAADHGRGAEHDRKVMDDGLSRFGISGIGDDFCTRHKNNNTGCDDQRSGSDLAGSAQQGNCSRNTGQEEVLLPWRNYATSRDDDAEIFF